MHTLTVFSLVLLVQLVACTPAQPPVDKAEKSHEKKLEQAKREKKAAEESRDDALREMEKLKTELAAARRAPPPEKKDDSLWRASREMKPRWTDPKPAPREVASDKRIQGEANNRSGASDSVIQFPPDPGTHFLCLGSEKSGFTCELQWLPLTIAGIATEENNVLVDYLEKIPPKFECPTRRDCENRFSDYPGSAKGRNDRDIDKDVVKFASPG